MSANVERSRRPTILIVDDTPQNLSLMHDILEQDFTVKLAPSGSRALVIAANNTIDLVLLDIMMPEMDGYEVCRRLKANPASKDIPVIFVTTVPEEQGKKDGLLLGAVDYITKPVVPDVLLACIRHHLAGHH